MKPEELENILEYYNKYATLKEREVINKALVKRDSKPLKKYLKKHKREVLRLQSDTDRRLYKIRECINTSLTENKTLKFRDSLTS